MFFGRQTGERDFAGTNSAFLSDVKGIDSKRNLLKKPAYTGFFGGFLHWTPKR